MAAPGQAQRHLAGSTSFMSGPLRVFLDSNIVFSAARDTRSELQNLWLLPAVDILLSQYVLEEVGGHLVHPDQRAALWKLVYRSHLVPDPEPIPLPDKVDLPEKDQPILQAAIASKAHILVTGDKRHFGPLFGQTVLGVRIESTSVFKNRYPEIFRREQKQ